MFPRGLSLSGVGVELPWKKKLNLVGKGACLNGQSSREGKGRRKPREDLSLQGEKLGRTKSSRRPERSVYDLTSSSEDVITISSPVGGDYLQGKRRYGRKKGGRSSWRSRVLLREKGRLSLLGRPAVSLQIEG